LTLQWLSKKILKITGIILGILIVLIAAFHIWFVTHAKDILENMVSSKSNGRLKLKVGKLKFGYFSTKMEIQKAVFLNTDTLDASTAYRFSVANIKINVNSILPIIFKRQILIDSLSLNDPDVIITRLKAPDKNEKKPKKDFSIPEEMGKVYNSIREALQILHVKRFEINNAKFTLINKVDPDEQPITLTKIFFHIDNIRIDSSEGSGKEKILFGENAVLRNRNQDVVFPDGRHKLSYSRFRINLRKRLVEFDSCTVAATKTDSANASFKVFFDKLLLTNIDFDTLYRHNVIKADSVYCLNPRFDLDVKVSKKANRDKPPPKFDQIIQQLTGDMLLGFVIVNNASFNINIERDGNPSSFTSDHNNFEIQGFNVDEGAAKPLKIKSFAMAIRNYENFLRDSSYSMQFDSILFNNNRISLSNFTLRQLNQGKITNSFNIPQFQLKGLSWEELVFNNRLIAEEAILYHPLINFTFIDRIAQKKKQNVFSIFSKMGSFIQLDELRVIDGKINLNLKKNVQLQLENANFFVKSNSLLHSKKILAMENSLEDLQFQHGTLKTNDITVKLDDVRYSGHENDLQAGKIQLYNRQKTLSAQAQQVSLDSIMIDDSAGNLEVNGMQWKKADIKISIAGNENKNSTFSSILLKNIGGSNTNFNIGIGERSVSGFLKTISINSLNKQPGKKVVIETPYAEGNKLAIADKESLLTISDYKIVDGKRSSFQHINYSRYKNNDSINFKIASLSLVPDINAIISGRIKADDVDISNPIVFLKSLQAASSTSQKDKKLPQIEINRINFHQPEIDINQVTNKGLIKIKWNGSTEKTNDLSLTGIAMNNEKLSIKQGGISLNHFNFTDNKGKIFNTGNGIVTAHLKNINARQASGQSWNWSSFVENISATNFVMDSLGKQAGRLNLDRLQLENFSMNSSTIKNLQKIADENPTTQIKEFTGQYNNAASHFSWFNAGFDQKRKTISIDSFEFRPTLDQDAYITSKQYQTDYLKTKTGRIIIEGFDPSLYFRDSVLKIKTISIDDVVLTDFRDTRPPFHAGIIKPLPAQLIQKIPIKISIDSLLLTNAKTAYTELNNRTLETATIPITKMTIQAFPIKNFNLKETDTIRIQVNGYLMDSIWIRLRIRESYLDTLSGFLMTVRIKPTDLQVLNPVFMPLSSVKLQSGYLDTLSLRVIAKDYFAYGEMKMLYHDLKIKFLNNGSEIKKGFLSGLKTFVANSFIIKNKNRSRPGRVFFLRNRERSTLNYIVKIAMSGIASSVGAKSNRKILRRYKKELKLRNLPAFEYD
jgi:hypothetical protein